MGVRPGPDGARARGSGAAAVDGAKLWPVPTRPALPLAWLAYRTWSRPEQAGQNGRMPPGGTTGLGAARPRRGRARARAAGKGGRAAGPAVALRHRGHVRLVLQAWRSALALAGLPVCIRVVVGARAACASGRLCREDAHADPAVRRGAGEGRLAARAGRSGRRAARARRRDLVDRPLGYGSGYAVPTTWPGKTRWPWPRAAALALETTYTGECLAARGSDLAAGAVVGPVLFWDTHGATDLRPHIVEGWEARVPMALRRRLIRAGAWRPRRQRRQRSAILRSTGRCLQLQAMFVSNMFCDDISRNSSAAVRKAWPDTAAGGGRAGASLGSGRPRRPVAVRTRRTVCACAGWALASMSARHVHPHARPARRCRPASRSSRSTARARRSIRSLRRRWPRSRSSSRRSSSTPGLAGVVLISGKPDNFPSPAPTSTVFATAKDRKDVETFSRKGHEVLKRIANSKVPIVAAIHGACLGAGLELGAVPAPGGSPPTRRRRCSACPRRCSACSPAAAA